MFIVRQSNHIQEDIKRNWSSWNYGQEGVTATEEELEAAKASAIENDSPIYISGFELWGDEINSSTILELYPNYWVLVDLSRGWGLSCNVLDVETLEEAIAAVSATGFEVELGEGQTVDCSAAKVVWSDEVNGIHILEVE